MARTPDTEETVGLLVNDDLYEAESEPIVAHTSQESRSPARSPTRSLSSTKVATRKQALIMKLLTWASLILSAFAFLVLFTAFLLIKCGNYNGQGNWRSPESSTWSNYAQYVRTSADATFGVVFSGIINLICFLAAFHNLRRGISLLFGAVVDLLVASSLFPFSIYAVTSGFPTDNWCRGKSWYWDTCEKLVLGNKALIGIGAGFGFLISIIHLALLVTRTILIKENKSWKRPMNTKFRIFRFDFDITVTKMPPRKHTCSCCAKLAASGPSEDASPAAPASASSVVTGNFIEV